MATKNTKTSINPASVTTMSASALDAEIERDEQEFAAKTAALRNTLSAEIPASNITLDTAAPYSAAIAELVPYAKGDGLYAEISNVLVASYKEDVAINTSPNGRLDRIAGMAMRLDGKDKTVSFARASVLAAGKRAIEISQRNAQELAESAETSAERKLVQDAVKAIPTFAEWAASVMPNTPQATASRLSRVGELFVNPAMQELTDVEHMQEALKAAQERKKAEQSTTERNRISMDIVRLRKGITDAENGNAIIKTARYIMDAGISVFNLAELTVVNPLVTAALVQTGKLTSATTQREIRGLTAIFKSERKTSDFVDFAAVQAYLRANPDVGDALVECGMWNAVDYPYSSTNPATTDNTSTDNTSTDNTSADSADAANSSTNPAPASDTSTSSKPVTIGIQFNTTDGRNQFYVSHETIVSFMKSIGYIKLNPLKRVKGDNSHIVRELWHNADADTYAVTKSFDVPSAAYAAVVAEYVNAETDRLAADPAYENLTMRELRDRKRIIERDGIVYADTKGYDFWVSKI